MKKLCFISSLSLMLLTGCINPIDQDAANAVITALPQEVAGCTFVGDVDSRPRYVITQARFDAKLEASRLGATHIVETHAFAAPFSPYALDFGIVISARAYKCPIGKGVQQENPEALLPSPEVPHPTLWDDDPFMGPFPRPYLPR